MSNKRYKSHKAYSGVQARFVNISKFVNSRPPQEGLVVCETLINENVEKGLFFQALGTSLLLGHLLSIFFQVFRCIYNAKAQRPFHITTYEVLLPHASRLVRRRSPCDRRQRT